MVVVPWGGPTAFQVGSLEVCRRGKTESTMVVEEMELIYVQKEETLVQLLGTGSEKGNVKEEGSLICQIKTRVETLAPVEPQGGIPETKMATDGVSLWARQERL